MDTHISKSKEREMKRDSLQQLRKDLTLTPQDVRTEIKCHISLPTEEAHHKSHLTRGPHLMAQRVNPQISQRIMELVQEGMTNPQEVRKALNHYVRTVMCTENPPDPDDRAYFPANRDLKNHIYKAKRAFELSKFDQYNLAKKLVNGKSLTQSRVTIFVPTSRLQKHKLSVN